MDKEVGDINRYQKDFQNNLDLMEDRVMVIEMSAKGAHTMLVTVWEEVQDLNNLMANISNQLELVCVEDIAWCQSRILVLERPNNPANKSLWQLVNHLSHQIKDQDDLIKDLQAGLVGAKNRVLVLEMLSSMIRLRVSVLEEAMEIDPPVMDLSGDDSTDSEYSDINDGGAMLVDSLEDERDQENVTRFFLWLFVLTLLTHRLSFGS